MSILLIILAAIAAGATFCEGLLNQSFPHIIGGFVAYRAMISIHKSQMADIWGRRKNGRH